MAAAEYLKEKNVDFILVEAQERLGGRIKNFDFKGFKVEDGANWIHGQYNKEYCGDEYGPECEKKRGKLKFLNPTWKWQKIHNDTTDYMQGAFTDYESETAIMYNGAKVDEKINDKCWEWVEEKAMDFCEKKASNLLKKYCESKIDLKTMEDQDTTLRQCFEDSDFIKYDNLTKDEKLVCKAVEWEMDQFETGTMGASLIHNVPLNTKGLEAYNVGDFLITDQRGYSHFLKMIAKGFWDDIIMSTKVEKISYTDTGVNVETDNGYEIQADYAICTVPLGVLQHKDLTFDPPFSKAKVDAIKGFEMGNYAKIYVKFPSNFWGDKEVLKFIDDDGAAKSIMTWGLNLDHEKYFPGSKMLTFHPMGETARRIENQLETETMKEVNVIMKKMFGPTAPDATEIHVTNWTNNPFSYGSWSSIPHGYSMSEWELVRKNEKRLYFAGEHTSYNLGFVHSAYDSGKETAKRVFNHINGICNPSRSVCPMRACVSTIPTTATNPTTKDRITSKDTTTPKTNVISNATVTSNTTVIPSAANRQHETFILAINNFLIVHFMFAISCQFFSEP